MQSTLALALLLLTSVAAAAGDPLIAPPPSRPHASKLEAALDRPGSVVTTTARHLGILRGTVEVTVEFLHIASRSIPDTRQSAGLAFNLNERVIGSLPGSFFVDEEAIDPLAVALAAMTDLTTPRSASERRELSYTTPSGLVFRTIAEGDGSKRFEIGSRTFVPIRLVFPLDEASRLHAMLVATRGIRAQLAATNK